MDHAEKVSINEIVAIGILLSYTVGQWLIAILCTVRTIHMYSIYISRYNF